ncbi:hypothetical protein H1S01_20455 [Heliobacterium chlorum]|uniref:Uncharacterized protein n=1 Tax=Heliobacterium chlorum TaxID=2698 RepID=A0ABR7T7K7_HELCL|nr:hypothetical protein [Heliobacterium chlorum]MBC9786764.1 hypothetical protein [Heliobacterium chlorum]
MAFDAFMTIDEALNSNMKFIAIDMSNLKELNDTSKEQILKHLEKYGVKVMEDTFEQLEAKGFYNPQSMSLDGVLLRVEKTDVSNKAVIIEGSKFRSALGSVGIKVVVEYIDGNWKVTKADITRIS